MEVMGFMESILNTAPQRLYGRAVSESAVGPGRLGGRGNLPELAPHSTFGGRGRARATADRPDTIRFWSRAASSRRVGRAGGTRSWSYRASPRGHPNEVESPVAARAVPPFRHRRLREGLSGSSWRDV